MDRASRPEGEITDIQHGWDVYSADEEKVGNVDNVEQGYLLAHKGILFPKDLYIPFSAIRRIEHDRVYLKVAKDDVADQGWDTMPADTGATEVAATGGRETRRATADVATERAGAARTTERDQTLHLHEEELRVNKERVQAGEVRLGKEVVEEQKTVSVPVTREEVYIERKPGDRQPDDHTIGEGADETIRVPLSEERVEVEKVSMVTEEVGIGKRQVQETQQVTDTVKREEARIEASEGARVEGAGATGGWAAAMPRYRRSWQQGQGVTGGRWEDAEPGYQYGWQMANDPRYRGRAWSEVEPALRRDWGTGHANTPWDRVRDAIRDAFGGGAGRT